MGRGAQRLGGLTLPIDRDRIPPDLIGHPVGSRADRLPVVGGLGQMVGGPGQHLREAGNACDGGHHYTTVTGGVTAASWLVEAASFARYWLPASATWAA